MKATKKIVGAACALVAAVALSAGSTFAWFSASGKVTATGMKVQAVVPTNLYIEEGLIDDVDAILHSTIAFTGDTTELKPARLEEASGTITVKDADEYTTEPDQNNAGVASTYSTIGTITSTADTLTAPVSNYVYRQTMSIVNKGGESDEENVNTNDINVKVTVAGGTKTTSFLKCAFVITVGETISYVDAGAGAKSGSDFVFTKNGLIEDLADNKIAKIGFLVWYDGDDEDCYVSNAVKVEELTISIEYNTTAFTAE